MHVVIINGSPRRRSLSNTEQIIGAFARGLAAKGVSFETHAVSERGTWDEIRAAYLANDEVLIALPLFVECVPGLLLEFLETLSAKDEGTRLSFILQGGFAEGCQFRCGEAFLERLPSHLGVRYGGCLVKGDNFMIRLKEGDALVEATRPYQAMGELFTEGNGFLRDEARAFTGPERFSAPVRLMLSCVFKTFARRMFDQAALSWGCTTPLDAKVW